MKNKFFNFSNLPKFTLASMTIFYALQGEATSTRIGNVVECRQEDNNGNGLYIKRENCYQSTNGTSGQQYLRCNYKAYFTAEGQSGSKSVIERFRDISAFPKYAEKYTDIDVRDFGDSRFKHKFYESTSQKYIDFEFMPYNHSGRFVMNVWTSTKQLPNNFLYKGNYIYNCSYIP